MLTSNFTYVNNGTAQYFQNGALLNSPQFGLKLLNGNIGNYYVKGLSESTRSALGAAYTTAISLAGGSLRQFFTGGTIDWKANGTGEVRFSSYPIGSTGSSINADYIAKFNEVDGWVTLGNPISNVGALTGGSIQLFSTGSIVQTASGVYVLDAATTSLYRQEQSALGLPTGDRVAISNGFRQDFEKGIIFSTSNQAFILKDTFASYYRSLNSVQLQKLGALTSNFSYVNGGTAQYFQNGAIYQSTAGTFSVQGEIYKQLSSRGSIGMPIGDQKVTSYGLRQDFTEGSIIYSSQLDIRVVDGALGKYYQSLTEDQKTNLGATYGEQYYYGNNSSFRLFQGGALELNRNGINQVRLTTASVGLDGNVLNDKFISKFLAAGNFDGLGDPVTNIVSSNGILRQDFQKGSIIQSGTNIFSVDGLIGQMYRQNGSSLGLPNADKVATANGYRQEFQNGILISMTATNQAFMLKNTIADHYRSLTSNQLQELGNVLSDATEVKDGFIQYFQNGAIYKSAAGTFRVRGEIGKLVSGRGLPGVAINEEKVTSYGVRQDFTAGTVIYSPQTGTRTIDGALGKYYQSLTETQKDQLGVTYGEQLYYGNNSSLRLFRGGVIELNQNGINQVRFFANAVGFDGNSFNERFISKFFAARYFEGLGDPTTAVVNNNGVLRQDFQKGSIVQSDTGLFVIDSKLVQSYTQNVGSLGAPIGETVATSYGLRQDFQKGIIFQSSAGNFVVDGLISSMYRDRFTSFGVPISNKISTVHGIRQDFQNGTLVATPATSQTFAFTDSIDEFYRGLSDAQLQVLGAPKSDAEKVTGGVRQYFQNGSIDRSSAGIFMVTGEIGKRIYGQRLPGVAIGAEKVTSYGLRQDFSEGTVMYSVKNGVNVINGPLGDYYQGLTEEQKSKLGETYGSLYGINNNSFYRFFYGGIVDYNRNGVNQVRLTNGSAVAFDGNFVNERFIAQYISAGNLDTLGDPITNVLNINGTLRQDFQKGYIVQNGYAIDSRLYNGTLLASSNISQPVNNGGVINITFGTTFPIKGSVGDYYYNKISAEQRQSLGQPTEAEVFLGNGLEWRQNFQNGTIFHGARGSYIVQNSLRDIYNALSSVDRQRLGMPISNETDANNYWHQYFERGELQLVQGQPVKWTDGGGSSGSSGTQNSYSYFDEGAHGRTNTQWAATVYAWNSSAGTPPENFMQGSELARLDLGSNTLSNGKKGISLNVGQNALKNYNDRLPVDNFAIRAYTQADFDGNEYKFLARGDDGFQILAKNIATNEWIYITPQNQWQEAYGAYKEITYKLPPGRYDLHFHLFEKGGDAYFDLSWDKVNSPSPSRTAYTVQAGDTLSGIAASRLGSVNYWTQITDVNGNTFTEQQARNLSIGQIVYLPGNVTNNTPIAQTTAPVNSSISPINLVEFHGVVMPTIGVNLRYSPNLKDQGNDTRAYLQTVYFDAWTTGESVIDVKTQLPDNQWFRIKGTNQWVPSAYIDGNPGRSITQSSTANNPTVSQIINSGTISNTFDSPNLPTFITIPEWAPKVTKLINIQGIIGNLWLTLDEFSYDVSSVLKISKNYFGKNDILELSPTVNVSISSSAEIELEKKLTESVGLKLNANLSNGISIAFGDETTTLGVPQLTPLWISSGTFSVNGSFAPLATLPIDTKTDSFGTEISMNLEVKGTYIDMSKLKEQLIVEGGIAVLSLVGSTVVTYFSAGTSTPATGPALARSLASLSLAATSLASAITTVASRGGIPSIMTFLQALWFA